MGNLVFTERAWEEYLNWQVEDKKTLKRINLLAQRHPAKRIPGPWKSGTSPGKSFRNVEPADR